MVAGGAGWPEILTRFAEAQLRAAMLAVATMAARAGRPPRINPAPFVGVSSLGFPISEPLVSVIDKRVPAPVEVLPAPWWGDDPSLILGPIRQLVASEIADTHRSAAQAETVAQGKSGYVRALVPPTCKRCAVLAGKFYRWSSGFERHPGCDCVNEPVGSLEEAIDRGLVVTPDEAYRRGWIRDLTVGERRAIEDGADITGVINSAAGIQTVDAFGRRAKVTTRGTTKRAAWRKANPTLPVRLRPEAIYKIVDREFGGDRSEALRLLRLYGYLSE